MITHSGPDAQNFKRDDPKFSEIKQTGRPGLLILDSFYRIRIDPPVFSLFHFENSKWAGTEPKKFHALFLSTQAAKTVNMIYLFKGKSLYLVLYLQLVVVIHQIQKQLKEWLRDEKQPQ